MDSRDRSRSPRASERQIQVHDASAPQETNVNNSQWIFNTPSYADINTTSWKLGTINRTANSGVAFATMQASSEGKGRPSFILLSPNETPPYVEFPLDLEPMKGKPTFLSKDYDPKQENNKVETLDLALCIPNSMGQKFTEVIENGVQTMLLTDASTYFDKKTATAIANSSPGATEFSSSVKHKDNSEESRLKLPIVLGGPAWALTNIIIKKTNGENVNGAGWDFLSKHMGPNRLRNAKVFATINVNGVWIRSKNFGMKLQASEVLMKLEATEEDHDTIGEKDKWDNLHDFIMRGGEFQEDDIETPCGNTESNL